MTPNNNLIGALAVIIGGFLSGGLAGYIIPPKKQPEFKIFDMMTSDKPKSQPLGEWQVCALVAAGETHYDQKCVCSLARIEKPKPQIGEWKLNLNADPARPGSLCNCQAACFNGLRNARRNPAVLE